MTPNEQPRAVIGFRTALVLFALLIAVSFATLKGVALLLALLIVLALAVKTFVHHLRSRID